MENDYYDEEMKNPNLYVTLASSGGLWSAAVYPWQEALPWTFNEQN
jgi:hypothetical protein